MISLDKTCHAFTVDRDNSKGTSTRNTTRDFKGEALLKLSKKQIERRQRFGRKGPQKSEACTVRGENREWRSAQSGPTGPKVMQLIALRDRKKTAMEQDGE